MVATTYDVLCDFKFAEEARNHLAKLALKGEVDPAPAGAVRTSSPSSSNCSSRTDWHRR